MMTPHSLRSAAVLLCLGIALATPALGQIGRRFPSEKKIVPDPVTGIPLTFLTSTPAGDQKIYQTHPQWTADGKWLVFRSDRVSNQAMAVNEDTGDIVQVTEGGYTGMLCIAQKSMKLFLMRDPKRSPNEPTPPRQSAPLAGIDPAAASGGTTPSTTSPSNSTPPPPRPPRLPRALQIIEVDLAKVFSDSAAGKMQPAASYERLCGTLPEELDPGADMALDAEEDYAYLKVGAAAAAKHLAADVKIESNFGPRNMGAGPTGLVRMNLKDGTINFITAVPFQIGHVQSNPYVSGEIVFCWETGGKAPQRTWTVMADGTGLRPLYPEANYEWVTHEAVIGKDEVAVAILGHRKPGFSDEWGPAATREHPTGLGIINLRTREMRIAGQTAEGSGLWHVHGSADGRWAVGDDFSRSIYLIDRKNGEMVMLSTGHKSTASDHPHPTFKPDGTTIQIQSAMLSANDTAMNICLIPVPDSWLKRTYPTKVE